MFMMPVMMNMALLTGERNQIKQKEGEMSSLH